MTKIPSSTRSLRASAFALDAGSASIGEPGNVSSLLRFYSLECAVKARYIAEQLAQPHGDTSAIPDGTFGKSGHDLDAARKLLRAPATLPAAPALRIEGGSASIESAHQLWRYNIPHEGRQAADEWMALVANWLRETR